MPPSTTMLPLEWEQLRQLIASAILAPSPHNTQPWLFRVTEQAIVLMADRTRALPVNDPHDRELTMSCGAALLNLRLAARELGRRAHVTLATPEHGADVLARVELGPAGPDEPGTAGLAAAMLDRHTYRGAFTGAPLPQDLPGRLIQAAEVEGASLTIVTEEERRVALAGLVAEADRIQFADPRWRRELAAWTHPRHGRDGMAASGLRSAASRLSLSPAAPGRDPHDAGIVASAPLLGVLSTARDTEVAWLAAGQALQRVLLTAAVDGVQVGLLNQPCQVASLRTSVRHVAGGDGHPQAVLRMGYPVDVPNASPRRPLDDVLRLA